MATAREDEIGTRLDTLGWGGTHENDWRLFRSFARSKHVQTLQSIQETIPFQGQTDCAAFDQYHLASLPQPMLIDSASR